MPQTRIRSTEYSIDFALSPDLLTVFVIEINNFLPPLAGCGLFDYYSMTDRQIIAGALFPFVESRPYTLVSLHLIVGLGRHCPV